MARDDPGVNHNLRNIHQVLLRIEDLLKEDPKARQRIERTLVNHGKSLVSITQGIDRMATASENLAAAMERLTTEVGETVTKLEALAQEIRDNANNPAAMQAAADKAQALADTLDQAQNPADTTGGGGEDTVPSERRR
jgi:methyl-accepting chemotaxis protein